MLIFLALIVGPVLTAALLSLLGPCSTYFGRLRILCIAVGAVVLIGIVAVRGTTDGPTTDGLLHLRHAITLREGVEIAVPFDLRRTNGYGYEIELHLDATLPTNRWKPLHALGHAFEGLPVT